MSEAPRHRRTRARVVAARTAGTLVAALACLTTPCLTTLAAQLPGPLARAAPAGADSAATGRAPSAVLVRGAPRSYQIVAVPVPAGLPATRTVRYTVTAAGAVTILGSGEGTLAPAAGARSLLLTIGVPAGARAGRMRAARVRFVAPDGPVVDVPVDLDVDAVHRVGIAMLDRLRGARPGERVEIHYRLTNLGNTTDSLEVRLEMPRGWPVPAAPPERLPLQPGATVERTARLTIPAGAGSGGATLHVVAHAAGEERARATAVIEVQGAATASAHAGPTLRASSAVVGGGGGETRSVLGLEVDGPLTRGVRVIGRASTGGRVDAGAYRGLSRVGFVLSPPFLTLVAPSWQASAGSTGLSLTELAGHNAWGRGAAGSYTSTEWNLGAFAARPAVDGGHGSLWGARAGTRVRDAWVTTAIAHLTDGRDTRRRLDAVSVGAALPTAFGATLSGELAHRRHADGNGLGWMTEVARHRAGTSLRLRALHAPGGGGAFARATDELFAALNQDVTRRLALGVSGWSARDTNPTFSRMRSSGWSVVPRYRLDRAIDVGLDLRGISFDADGANGSFGNTQRQYGAFVNMHRGILYGTSSASLGAGERRTKLSGGLRAAERSPRAAWRSLAGAATQYGLFELSTGLESNGRESGALGRQNDVGARADRVPVLTGHHGILLGLHANAELRRYGWFGDRPALLAARVGLTAGLPGDLRVTLDTERDPFFRSTAGGGWITALRLEHARRLPALDAAASAGLVYQDANANGTRDAGEAGFAGAVVRRGARISVTDARGRFAFEHEDMEPVRLDPRSLPFGWLEGQGPTRGAGGRWEIGVIPTAAVEVRLVAVAGEDGRVPEVDLAAALVSVEDARGRRWTARVTAAGAAVFDALPAGEYGVRLELGALREPLRAGELPRVRVSGGAPMQRLTIPLAPRPVRIWRPDGAPPPIPAAPPSPASPARDSDPV